MHGAHVGGHIGCGPNFFRFEPAVGWRPTVFIQPAKPVSIGTSLTLLTMLTMLTLKYPLILLKEERGEKYTTTRRTIKRRVLENTVSIVSQFRGEVRVSRRVPKPEWVAA